MTSRCTDERFEKQLYAYELGLLDEVEREALELHLMECEHCFAKVERFAPTADLLRESPAVRELVARQGGDTPSDEVPPRKSRPIRPLIFRWSLAAAAVLAFLILKPWQFEFRPTHEVVAAENRLAVLRFENLTRPEDPDRLGDIISRLLITDLSESSYLQVVSSQRVEDIRKLLGEATGKTPTSDQALEIARKASAHWLLTGNIIETGGRLNFTLQLIDAGTGVILSSPTVDGLVGESVFALADRLDAAVRESLSLPDQAREEVHHPVADVTTTSPEAYRYYVEGIELTDKYYFPDAIKAFEKALQCDSTFAMAYFYLAMIKDTKLVSKAVEYSKKASWIEQRYIAALSAQVERQPKRMVAALREILARFPDEKEAHYRLGEWYWSEGMLDSAEACFNRTVAIDPLCGKAYNFLSYVYSEKGDLDKAIWAVDKYISLAPGEANPLDSRGDLYAANGDCENAVQSYMQALKIKPDYQASRIKLACMRIFQGRYEEADSVLQIMGKSDDLQNHLWARYYGALIPMRQGKLKTALDVLDTDIAESHEDFQKAGKKGDWSGFFGLKARIHAYQGFYDLALADLDTAISMHRNFTPTDSSTFLYQYAQYLAARGDFDRASSIQQQLAARAQATRELPCYQYWAAAGIELARGNPTAAAGYAAKAAALTSITADFTSNYLLARAYLQTGNLGQAVPLLERLEKIYASDRLPAMIDMVEVHYYLGIAYEESRWYDRAAGEYETFLDIWKNADPALPAVEDARQRLAKLRS